MRARPAPPLLPPLPPTPLRPTLQVASLSTRLAERESLITAAATGSGAQAIFSNVTVALALASALATAAAVRPDAQVIEWPSPELSRRLTRARHTGAGPRQNHQSSTPPQIVHAAQDAAARAQSGQAFPSDESLRGWMLDSLRDGPLLEVLTSEALAMRKAAGPLAPAAPPSPFAPV